MAKKKVKKVDQIAKKATKEVKKTVVIRHWGISVLAILAYIEAVLTALIGLAFIAGSAVVSRVLLKMAPEYGWLAGAGIATFIFLGLVLIVFAVIDYIIGRGLWDGKNWARILLLILVGISGIGALFSFQVISFIISAVIFWYLGFYKEAVDYFK